MAGEKTKLDSDQQRLVEDNEGLVYHLVSLIRQKLPIRYEFDDLVGYGMLGLAEAARAFKPGTGTKFSTFAFFRVRGAIFDGISESSWMTRAQYRRHVEKAKREISPEGDSETWSPIDGEIVALDKEHYEQLADENPTTNSVEQNESAEILADCVRELPRREELLIQLIYFEGLPLNVAAERVGISKSWASRLHAKIIEKLGSQIRQKQNRRKAPSPSEPNHVRETSNSLATGST